MGQLPHATIIDTTTAVIRPTTIIINIIIAAAKSTSHSMPETAVASDTRVVDAREYVVHSPVDDENAPPDRGEQFGPHRRGMPSAVCSRRGVEAAQQSSTAEKVQKTETCVKQWK